MLRFIYYINDTEIVLLFKKKTYELSHEVLSPVKYADASTTPHAKPLKEF